MAAYKNRSFRLAAMKRILKGMKIPKLEVKHITFRMRMLRDMYVRELKKIGVNSGKYDRSFPYWFYRMHFLKGHLNTTVDLSGIQIKQYTEEEERYFGLNEDSDSYAFEDKEDRPSIHDPNDILIVKGEDAGVGDDDARSGRGESGRRSRPSEVPKREHSHFDGNSSSEVADGQTLSAEVVQRAILSLLEKEKIRQQTDYFDNFAKYVASLLRALPKSKAFELQPKIISMITAEHKRLSGPPATADDHY
ncbi:hypothetical protein EVAR_86979_1 [Eumeta japonica]|uniref:MADF domain-containing protein n=1 Tax=Eumeta variegata TaxID=151549 RepID=A0A4C1W5T7_EUMVA|nr:hypothetical protein EVAR_86979_1 [Eumeta japonica]